MTNYKIARVAR